MGVVWLVAAAQALLGAALPVPAAEPGYVIRTVAGSDWTGDGGPASSALLFAPEGIARDAAGNLYVADSADHRVRKITPAGIIVTVAGDGEPGFRGDGGPASAARLDAPYGLAADALGNLYVADFGNARVRRIAPDGTIVTIAGGGARDPTSSGAAATAVRLLGPRNLALDAAGNLYVADFRDHRIYRVSPGGTIEVVAGTGTSGFSGNGGPALHAQLSHPAGLAFDRAGNLYIADSGNRRIRRLSGGVLSTVHVPVTLELPTGLAFDAAGNLYIADRSRIVKLAPSGSASTLALAARDLALDAAGNVFVVAGTPQLMRLGPTGSVAVVAGVTTEPRFWGDGGPATTARLDSPSGLALASDGSLYIADTGNARIRKVDRAGVISTVAGAGRSGALGDSLPALAARLFAPVALSFDSAGCLLIADSAVSRVRRLSAAGLLTNVAGTGVAGFNGDGDAVITQLNQPAGLAAAADGRVFVADTGNHRIRALSLSGTLATIAGRGWRGYAGDGGPALEALLDSPAGLALDRDGNLYIADRWNHVVRKLSAKGILTTVAGCGWPGFAGDGGPATQARLNHPTAVAVDPQGNLYIADTENHRIRKVTPDGIIRTIAGDGQPGFAGDGGPAHLARLRWPVALVADSQGNLYVADRNNHRVRILTPAWEPAPLQRVEGVVLHAATLRPGPVAPGQLVTILAPGAGPPRDAGPRLDPGGKLATRLEGLEVLWDGRPGPLLSVSRDEIRAQAPYAIADRKETVLEVRLNGELRFAATLRVVEASPAFFTGGDGLVAALNEDGTPNSPSNPAARGSVVSFFATGEGLTDPPSEEGRPAGALLAKPALPVSLTVGIHTAEILFAGSAPGMVGVLQINARIPGGFLPAGLLPVELRVGEYRSPGGAVIALQ
ncbi:MAG: hypothetical protein RMI94_00355 [Bryobacterales bacterium]|nr:hypothetical protein [Bryobacteraceae bacterium]MDW8128971.1 hypothetical protein [Bryobacterales bacterium]